MSANTYNYYNSLFFTKIDILFLDDLIGDSMHNMPVVVGNTVANVTGSGTGNYPAHPRSQNTKLTPMHIRSKFGQLGPSKGQFNSPHGFCLGTDEDIIVADTNNHRIQVLFLITTFITRGIL